MEVIILLAILFGTLAIIVPLIEKNKSMQMSAEKQAKLVRYIWPLIGISLLASAISMWLF